MKYVCVAFGPVTSDLFDHGAGKIDVFLGHLQFALLEVSDLPLRPTGVLRHLDIILGHYQHPPEGQTVRCFQTHMTIAHS